MNKKSKKIAVVSALSAGVAVVAATAGVVSHAVTKKLMSLALDRKNPQLPKVATESMATLKGDDALVAVLEKNREAVLRLEQSDAEQICIEGFDRIPLVGHLVRCEQPRRILIAMHGWRSSWANDFAAISDFWRGNGCHVLYVEQRGQNNSGGDYMGFGLLERHDCAAWAHWVAQNVSDTLPIYLCGISMGASSVLMACGLELPQNVCGVMADCGFTSPNAIWKKVVENNFRLSYKVRRGMVEKICRQKLNMGAEEITCPSVLRESRIPVLFIHGSDDHFVPLEMTFENYKACTAPKRLLVVPGAEHGLSYFADREAYEKESLAFWETFDAGIDTAKTDADATAE